MTSGGNNFNDFPEIVPTRKSPAHFYPWPCLTSFEAESRGGRGHMTPAEEPHTRAAVGMGWVWGLWWIPMSLWGFYGAVRHLGFLKLIFLTVTYFRNMFCIIMLNSDLLKQTATDLWMASLSCRTNAQYEAITAIQSNYEHHKLNTKQDKS